MSDLAWFLTGWCSAVLLATLYVWFRFDRPKRRSPERMMRDSAERARRNCAKGYHDWETPWKRERDHPVFWSKSSTRPFKIERAYTTTCRQCGKPRTETVEV